MVIHVEPVNISPADRRRFAASDIVASHFRTLLFLSLGSVSDALLLYLTSCLSTLFFDVLLFFGLATHTRAATECEHKFKV